MQITEFEWKYFCLKAMHEDKVHLDATSLNLIDSDTSIVAELISEGEGILCGIEGARTCFSLLDENVAFEFKRRDGDSINRSEVVARVSGKARAILGAERTALNLLYHLSGIATHTKKFVERAEKFGIEVYDTRKTIPLLRKFEKYAASVGGAKNHRLDLSQAIFIKDNHKFVLGGIRQVVKKYIEIRNQIKNLPLIVEVESLSEIEEVLVLKPDVIILDNFSLDELKSAWKKYGQVVTLEASGGVSFDSLELLANAGVKRVSTSSIILEAKPLPFNLEVKEVIKS
ncbi:MAG: carboxylating nicotinate-nucleotide diphosphorylase [Actinobacteria bacterium]|nr:carboxylating nicotinate-nucleotide diphosphorylase [Actinomycetota bacterium]